MPEVVVRTVRVMQHLFKHPKSGVFYCRRVVPPDLRERLGQTEIRISLRTKDRSEAKRLLPKTEVAVEAKFSAARQGPIALSHQQIVALAGSWYERELTRREPDPGPEEQLDLEFDSLDFARDGGVWRKREAARSDVKGLLAREGLVVDDPTVRALELQLFDLKARLVLTLLQRVKGDYSPDPILDRLPQWRSAGASSSGRGQATITGLVEAWAAERKPSARTPYEWERVVKRLASHVGHDDLDKLSPQTIVSWKDALLASGKTPKTVKNHLSAVRALFGWAVANRRMAANPAAGVDVAAKDKPGERRRLPYSDEDAKQILTAARSERGAKRWVPWLLAVTGARLQEVCQSLVRDIRQEGDIWFLDINADEAHKSLKNAGSARKLPLHPALIGEGFLDYVRSLPDHGPLFPDLQPDRFGRRGGTGTKNLGRWVRKLGVTDPRKAPNHAWRHRFKDVCRVAGIEKPVHDALTGHASSDVGDSYGLGYRLDTLAAAIRKLPNPLDPALD